MIMELWHKQELETLKAHYFKISKEELVNLLPNRTWRAIHAKALQLGFKYRKFSPPWNSKEIDTLRKYRCNLTAEELQEFLPNRSIHGIRLKAERNQLHSNYYWTDKDIMALRKYHPNKIELLECLPQRSWTAIKLKARKIGMEPIDNKAFQKERFRKANKNPEFTSKRLKALCRKPTKPERQLIEIIQEYNLPYKYVGNGAFIIEGFNPDFINTNGKKNIIEVFGRVWHDTLVTDWKRTELGKIMVYNSYGYKTLVIWDDQLEDKEEIAKRIINFNKSRR